MATEGLEVRGPQQRKGPVSSAQPRARGAMAKKQREVERNEKQKGGLVGGKWEGDEFLSHVPQANRRGVGSALCCKK